MVVNRMKNEAGVPSRVAEDCYAKCVDMSDIQNQYKQTKTLPTTQATEMDYSLEEGKTVSLQQAKRIVQKAKNWDYASAVQSERPNSIPCKYAARCHDQSTHHRVKYSHSHDAASSIRQNYGEKTDGQNRAARSHYHSSSHHAVCKYGERCWDQSAGHRSKYSHPYGESISRTQCRHGIECYDQSDYHRTKYAHPGRSS